MQIYPPGTRIGQYEIASLPMMGGMGVVYFALDHGNDGRPVALKTFRPELLPDRAARDRFLREGTAWVELGNHPHIVRCYKVEYIDPTAFLVLELIAKEQNMPDASLRSWLIPGHPLPIDQALLFALQIARGMQYATEKIPGFVHRDLKPENILVGADRLLGTNINRLRVTDFGLVKTIADSSVSSTTEKIEELKPNQVQFTRGVGTPLYMAPEQWKGEPVGVFTDVYALGCILYEMLCGGRAVNGDNIAQLHEAHCAGKVQPFPKFLPDDVEALLVMCLALKPNQRYGNWSELTEVIEYTYSKQSGLSAPRVAEFAELSREDYMQEGWSYNAIGYSYADLGKEVVAAGYFEKALVLARQTGDRRGEGNALGNLGIVYLNLSNVRRAIEYHEQCLGLQREMGDRLGESGALGNLGLAYAALGNTQRAIGYYEQSLEIARETSNRRAEGGAIGNLGNAYLALGNARQAIECYKQLVLIAREIGDRRREGNALGNLGLGYAALGDFIQAIRYYEQALAIDREIGNRPGESAGLGSLGRAYKNLGDVQGSVGYYEQALAIDREIGDRHGEGIELSSLGTAYLNLGDAQRAIGYYEQAVVILREIGDRRGEGNALGNLGTTYATLGNTRQAIEYYEQDLAIAREVGDRRGEGAALGNLGIAYLNLGDAQRASGYYEQDLAIAREIGDRHGEGAALGNLGNALATQGDVQRAIEYYKQSLAINREIGDLIGLANGSRNMAMIYAQQGEPTRALPFAQESAQLFAQIGHMQNAQSMQQLIAHLKGSPMPQANSAQIAFTIFDAFQRVSSPQAMQAAVEQHPLLKDSQFIKFIEKIIKEEVPPEHKPAFEARLAWLREITQL
jgi:tetratricopeptide (TPR) repeat protein